jgi:hypothetical protein
MIKLDCTKHSVVITCDDCDYWYGFAHTRHEGLKTAARHEERVHPSEMRARKTIWEWEKRNVA